MKEEELRELREVLLPLYNLCHQYTYCMDCPLFNKDDGCQYTQCIIYGSEPDTVEKSGNLYLDLLNKVIHNHCGEQSCVGCQRKCSLPCHPVNLELN